MASNPPVNLVVHADWSASPGKRWQARAALQADGSCLVGTPELTGDLDGKRVQVVRARNTPICLPDLNDAMYFSPHPCNPPCFMVLVPRQMEKISSMQSSAYLAC